MSAVIESGPTRQPATALFIGGAVPAVVACALAAGASAISGGAAALSALFGGVLAAVALSVAPAIMRLVQNWSPPAVMGAAITGYAITMAALGVAYALTESAGWLSGMHAAAAMLTVTLACMVGQIRAVRRLRILAYGSGTGGDRTGAAPGQTGFPASPFRSGH